MKPFRIAELCLFLAAALFSLAFWMRQPSRLPGEADANALTARLKAIAAEEGLPAELPSDGGLSALKSGTLTRAVVLSPFWAERPRTWKLPLPIFGTARTTRPEDLWGLTEIFLVTFRELPMRGAPDVTETLRAAGFDETGTEETFGALSLRRFRPRQPRTLTFRATNALASAEVFLGANDHLPCASEAGGVHTCRGKIEGKRPVALQVRPTMRELNSKPMRCVDFMPQSGVPLSAAFHGVDLGEVFTVAAGPVGQSNARLKPDRAPLTFRVDIDGKSVSEWTWQPGDSADRRMTLQTRELLSASQASDGTQHTVTFTAQSDPAHPVGFCFEAEALR